MNVIVTGGGTGGHVFPALAVATACRQRGDDVTFVGATDGPGSASATEAGFPFVGVSVISAQTRLSWRTISAVSHIVRGAWAVRRLVREADAVVSLGGYAGAPASLAAGVFGRPLILIEPNAVPGVVNRVSARWAKFAATMFDATEARLGSRVRVVRTGTPLREEIVAVAAEGERARTEALEWFGLDGQRRTVLVFGGSQGSLSIDRAIADAMPLLADRADLQILIATGRAHLDVVTAAIDGSARLLVRAFGFIDRMDLALSVADLAVARAGGSVAELAACGVPAIVIPYPFATEDHQTANARELAAVGAAKVIFDRDLGGVSLAAGILEVMDDRSALEAMSRAMRAWARPDATAAIADLVREVSA